MKAGDKVIIRDGSWMMTIRNGKLTHTSDSQRYRSIGLCNDEFTVIETRLILPIEENHRKGVVNDTIIINDIDGSIWYCSSQVNLKSINEVKEMTMAEIIDLLGFDIKIKK